MCLIEAIYQNKLLHLYIVKVKYKSQSRSFCLHNAETRYLQMQRSLKATFNLYWWLFLNLTSAIFNCSLHIVLFFMFTPKPLEYLSA